MPKHSEQIAPCQIPLESRAYPHPRSSGKRRRRARPRALLALSRLSDKLAARHRFICFPTSAVWHKANPALILVCRLRAGHVTTRSAHPKGQVSRASRRKPDPGDCCWLVPVTSARRAISISAIRVTMEIGSLTTDLPTRAQRSGNGNDRCVPRYRHPVAALPDLDTSCKPALPC